MSSIFDAYKTNTDAEKEGKWFPSAFVPEAEFLLARAGGANTKFKQKVAVALKPHLRRLQDMKMPEEETNAIVIPIFVDYVLLNWKGVKLTDKTEYPFSKENAIKVLTSLPDLFAELRDKAQEFSNFIDEAIEDAVKN